MIDMMIVVFMLDRETVMNMMYKVTQKMNDDKHSVDDKNDGDDDCNFNVHVMVIMMKTLNNAAGNRNAD